MLVKFAGCNFDKCYYNLVQFNRFYKSFGVLKINSKHRDAMADARKGFISKLRVSSYVLAIISGNLLRITV